MSLLAKLMRRPPKPVMGSPAANDAVRAQLRALGDDGAAVRHVLHYAYPDSGADASQRPAMMTALSARGYEVKDAAANDGFVMEQHRSITPDDFDKATAELSAWFAERSWGYDGWECAVVQPTQH